ncbi:MAG: hypothetical protein JWL77_6592 [Chthonomonadaceae bacterium]|nr:hypothetical protein [Chthonomonadaceae bacterium]
MKRNTLTIVLALAGLIFAAGGRADVITDWNATLSGAIRTAGLLPGAQPRQAAVVQVSVFDAVNGIHRRYEPYFVTQKAPHNANREAAAVQAAYTALSGLFPTQQATFDAQLAASLAGIDASPHSIAVGRAWGQKVALAILDWRSHDGYNLPGTPYFGSTVPGVWRSVPNGGVAALLPQLAVMTPFGMTSPWQFRPGPPLALASARYAADVNEVKAIGSATSAIRTAEQTNVAKLWAAFTTADLNALVRSLIPPDSELVDEARIFALVNIASADGIINVWDAKYAYNFWRPFHAIRLAASAGNPAVIPDPTWTSLVANPNHQEYPSAHATATGAALEMLANLLGEDNTVVVTASGFPTFMTSYSSFTAAALGVQNARVWGGIHYRNSVNVGGRDGIAVADYIFDNFLTPRDHDDNEDDDGHDDDHDGGHGGGHDGGHRF